MGIGREGAVCEYIEIMQIPSPVRATMRAYKCVTGFLQYARVARTGI
jgi:hypothetical protein